MSTTAISRLLTIMQKLRDPESGCPWDVQQDFASIAPYTLEEAYEVVDAIERNDLNELKDELGDLLLQVVFHSQMADEIERFNFDDVCNSISDKMERRHPHVFANGSAIKAVNSADDVKVSWQQIKQQERGADKSILEGIPKALPALKKAQKLGSRASSLGFDWPSAEGAIDKIDEELTELKEAFESGRASAIEDEMGDVLFSLVNVCRHYGIDAESALSATNRKFTHRFAHVEMQMKALEGNGGQASLDQMDRWWEDAKKT